MRRLIFLCTAVLAVVLTVAGAEALVRQVVAAEGLKSSVIAFVLNLGFALLGPALLYALVFFHPRAISPSDSRRPTPDSRGGRRRHSLPQRLVPGAPATARQ